MAVSLLPHFNALMVKPWRNTRKPLQVKAQSYRDERKLSNNNNNVVDANLRVLRERIEKIQIKEGLEKCCRFDQYGWNYASGYDYKFKRENDLRNFFEVVRLISGTIGFTCLSGSAFLCLLSILIHLNQ